MFRGSGFAGLRDTISQGVPFMYASTVQSAVVDPLLKPQAGAGAGAGADEASDLGHGLRRAVAREGVTRAASGGLLRLVGPAFGLAALCDRWPRALARAGRGG